MTIKTLVQGFGDNIRQLKSPQYKESQARLHYIDPFWKLLGWDVSNEKQVPPQDLEVIVEPSMESVEDEGLRTREPDYLFCVNGFSRFIVEAKKPAIDIDTERKAIFQTKRYAWNATIPFAILTDFEQFRLYDTTLRPILNEPARGLVQEFKIDFQDYPAKWDEFIGTFGRDAVADGSLERLRARIRRISPNRRLRTVDRMLFELRGDEPVDKVFLDYLETYRKHFARAIYHDNKKDFPEADTLHGAARLTEAVQRLIDRLVFMRVCEDRGIRRNGGLKEMLDRISAEGGDIYSTLCAEFRELDREYNGYLFKYHFSESQKVSDAILSDLIRTLYPPDGPWDFSAIGDDILGIVYEKFLGSVVVVKLGEADVQEKPEVRHANGVYYTPRFVVDTIIRRVVGPKIAGRSPSEVLEVKILDPACGSGSFLVAAFQYLIDHCIKAITKDPTLARAPANLAGLKGTVPFLLTQRQSPGGRKKRKDIAFKDKKGIWQLAPDFKAALLINCIHGVDIDQQAVEVTVMSLYLKMLEGKLPPNWQRDWLENELLPPLDNNILCGNSLINSADFDNWVVDKHGGLFPVDDDIRFRMNRFDWDSRTRGFGRLLDSQAENERGNKGFDCIIGNPPYIRVQVLNEWEADECEFYKWRYKSAAKGNYDIYVVFVERCLGLLSNDGLLGFIIPHKFWQAKYGEGLRKIITEGKYLRSVLDFRQEQVFKGATTYTAIHVLSKSINENVDYAATTKLYDGIVQMAAINERINHDGIEYAVTKHPTKEPWTFINKANQISSLITSSGIKPLKEIARLAQGIKTSADKVFVVDIKQSKKGYCVVTSAQTGKMHNIETKVLWPLIKSEHMKCYLIEETHKALLFPYERFEGKYRPIPVKKWKKDFPNAWAYLNEVKVTLQSREKGRMASREDWYAYIYPKNFNVLSKPKLIIPDISEHMQICIDEKGKFIFSGGAAGGNAIIPHDNSIMQYLSALLNSKLIEKYLRQTGTKFRGGYLNCEIRFIKNIPIKLPEGAAEKKYAERIIESVREIMDAKTRLRDVKLSDRERRTLEGEVENHERRIDELVFRLYGVKGLPE
jgi:type I restriction-modification system DNA methylase subunit